MYHFSHPAVECGRNTWGGIHDVRDAPRSFEKPFEQRACRFHRHCRVTARWGARLSRSWCEPSAPPCRRDPVTSHSSALPGCPSSVQGGCPCYGTEEKRPTRLPTHGGPHTPPSFACTVSAHWRSAGRCPGRSPVGACAETDPCSGSTTVGGHPRASHSCPVRCQRGWSTGR